MILTASDKFVVLARSIIGCSGIAVTLISSSVLLSYAVEVFQTGSFAALHRTEMAPATALCFLFVGIACIAGALLWNHRRTHNDE